MASYKHTQIGYLMLSALFAVTALFGWLLFIISAEEELGVFVVAAMGIVIFILASFASLSAVVDDKYLRIKFSYGIFRKKFLLAEIASIKAVKNHWYYGWGIRVWFWPYMWIYNVSGFDAVEITMKNSKIYRIGTDEPLKLEKAITSQKHEHGKV